MRRFKSICLALIALLLTDWQTSRADAQIQSDAPGLILTTEGLQHAAAKLDFPDARVSRLVALYVPAGAPPSSFTPPGPFRATFTGDLNLRLRSYIRFSAEGRGRLTLSLNGAQVLQPSGDDLSKTVSDEIRLNKGRNQLVAVYESPATGDASVRLFWSSKSFLPEPLAPMLLTHPATETGVTRSLQARDGQFLLAEFRCVKCHIARQLDAPADTQAMPELAMDAPSLADVGKRFNRDWLAAWIGNPHALRPGAQMPRLFPGSTTETRASDIAAYLTAQSDESPPGPTPLGDSTTGGRIFANLDCVACHTTSDSKDDSSRVPLKFVKVKFKPDALRQYLLNPTAHYAWNPMPDFHLSDTEASDLMAFLLSSGATVEPVSVGDAVKGKQLVASSGCLNCHRLGEQKSVATAPRLDALTASTLSKGCLATAPATRGTAPDFALTDDQRAALVAFLATDRSSLSRTSAAEFAERQIGAMRCTACHARDASESLLAQSLDSESLALHQEFPNLPPGPNELLAAEQKVPVLTWAGEKLRPQWMAQFIAGQVPYKARYFLRARMPSFAARARLLAAGLAEEHGCAPALPPNPKGDPQLAEEGRKLCGKVPNVGFSCVQCHGVADVPPFAPFEAPSINLQYVSERLRHDYYTRWIHDPLRFDPASKMPRFDDAEGKTGLLAFGSDAKLQFEAIWQYLLEGGQIQPPQ